ncbi:unnamed protein product [Nyctereutes procyonoides]|uniref:(raccoon dog) hypothetical protein n=1 Tax=Nyctereutes procyonoides TaxID=34880 RepID=A0A811YV08_NYCPR|nr:unnamed protein product [Nyctereutes procyonoides]
MLRPLLLAALCLAGRPDAARGCQLPSEWRPLSEGCRAELAEIIVYARVLALHHEVHGPYNYLPWQYEAGDAGLFYSAEIEMLCDQAWGSMLEVPAGSRLNLTGLGYFSCHSHTVVQDYAYFFFLRATHLPLPWHFFPQLMCSSVQKALFEEEDHVKKLQQKVATLEKRNKQLRDRVKKVKRSLRQARKNGRHLELVNQKLSEKLAAAAGAIPHINALGQEPPGATYLRG